ncbi:MAG TPA: hypothetical protein VFA06_18475 [Actinocrinis sp.]|uniref:hypothetical protein n=1 Tax=Actinocrinis sp. TaxID=1920516 RepID=UPI002D6B1399|nr:hypothetical protein [Actinocrinis sp.]HZU57865.1 hypothetical protein [Actinocrinis sp.]
MDTAQSTPEARTRVKLPPDPYRDDEPRPGRGRRPLVLLAALVALVAAITIVNRSTHHSGGSPTADQSSGASNASNPATNPAGPVTSQFDSSGLPGNTADGVPIGYPHTARGAESAAANYVVAYSSSAMINPTERHKLIDAIADPAIASDLQTQLDTAYTQVDNSLGLSADGVPPSGQTFVQRSAPVGVTLVKSSSNDATVSVWTVTLSGLAGQGSTHPVVENWSTITVTLRWTGGDWKWVSFASTDGPVPTSGQQVVSGGQDLQKAVNQFGGLRYAR